MSLFIDLESLRNKIRTFRWYIKLFKWDDTSNSYVDVAAVVLIRSTATTGCMEVTARPYTMEHIRSHLCDVQLHETLKSMPFLTSSNTLSRLSLRLSTDLVYKSFIPAPVDPDYPWPWVFFFDIQITQREPYMLEKLASLLSSICKGGKDEENSSESAKDEAKLEKIEDIEEYLKSCPNMMAVGSNGMEEVKGGMDVDILKNGEKEVECSICSKSICVDDRFAETPCLHRFHVYCMGEHRRENDKTSCPLCGSSYVAHL